MIQIHYEGKPLNKLMYFYKECCCHTLLQLIFSGQTPLDLTWNRKIQDILKENGARRG